MQKILTSTKGEFHLCDAAMFEYAAIKGITLYPEFTPGMSVRHFWKVPEDVRSPHVAEHWSAAYQEADEAGKAKFDAYNRANTVSRFVERDDPVVLQMAANPTARETYGWKFVEIPDGVEYEVDQGGCESCGLGPEFVAEKHRVWS